MDALVMLQEWYASHCDGEWEHDRRVRLSTIYKPGWSLSIGLMNTALDDRAFSLIEREVSDSEWVHCWIENGTFEERCGARQLEEMILEFLTWANDVPRDSR
jgi:hypothetical protein